ncbi:MAG: phospholipase D-like domain-containing protein [Acidimicrobiales bacterium]
MGDTLRRRRMMQARGGGGPRALRAALRHGVGVLFVTAACLAGPLPANATALPRATPFAADVSAAGPHSEGLIGVLVEPSRLGSAGGMRAIYDFVLSAKKSVDMTMYEFIDPTMVKDLGLDVRRHVKVRVILDTNLERSRNTATYKALKAEGVGVVWADTAFAATHQKTITVDGKESLVMSLNLDDEYGYYTTTRDFGVFDTSPKDVAAITAVFDGDYAHRPIKPSDGTDLVWSPGSQPRMLAVINGARKTLSIENEEMDDAAVTGAIVAAARRGVKVEVTMVADRSYDGAWSSIVAAGGHVHLYADGSSDLYIHAKVTIADAGLKSERIYVGSINFSSASMNYNRELGIITGNATIVKDINAVVSKDFADCSPSTDCTNYR